MKILLLVGLVKTEIRIRRQNCLFSYVTLNTTVVCDLAKKFNAEHGHTKTGVNSISWPTLKQVKLIVEKVLLGMGELTWLRAWRQDQWKRKRKKKVWPNETEAVRMFRLKVFAFLSLTPSCHSHVSVSVSDCSRRSMWSSLNRISWWLVTLAAAV